MSAQCTVGGDGITGVCFSCSGYFWQIQKEQWNGISHFFFSGLYFHKKFPARTRNMKKEDLIKFHRFPTPGFWKLLCLANHWSKAFSLKKSRETCRDTEWRRKTALSVYYQPHHQLPSIEESTPFTLPVKDRSQVFQRLQRKNPHYDFADHNRNPCSARFRIRKLDFFSIWASAL